MQYNTIPGTDLEVSAICLGTWVFGGDMWSGADEKDCLAAVQTGLDNGINFIDTAPIYGDGLSERIVGKAIKGNREKFVIATKCGLSRKGGSIAVDLSPESIFKEIDLSLERLGIDCVDLYQCHWSDPKVPIEKTLEALLKIKEQGKIKHIGVSNFEIDILRKAADFTKIATLQSQYSILDREIEENILPFCESSQIGFLAYGPLGGGILSGKYKSPHRFPKNDARSFFYKFYTGPEFEQAQKIIKVMESVDKPLYQTAINWVKQQKGVTSVIVGCRNAQQTIQNAQTTQWLLSGEDLHKISSLQYSRV